MTPEKALNVMRKLVETLEEKQKSALAAFLRVSHIFLLYTPSFLALSLLLILDLNHTSYGYQVLWGGEYEMKKYASASQKLRP